MLKSFRNLWWLALPRGDEGQPVKALRIKDKSALLQAACYHSLLPPSSRQLLDRPRARHRERGGNIGAHSGIPARRSGDRAIPSPSD
jgi:hypothetical protein